MNKRRYSPIQHCNKNFFLSSWKTAKKRLNEVHKERYNFCGSSYYQGITEKPHLPTGTCCITKKKRLEQKFEKPPEGKVFPTGLPAQLNLMMQCSILDSGTINGSDSCSAVQLVHLKLDKCSQRATPLFQT